MLFTTTSMPSTTSVLSTYTSVAASAMLIRTVINEVQTMTGQLIPSQLQEKILSRLGGLFESSASQMTLLIDEHNGYSINEMYEASKTFLSTKITPSVVTLNVSKAPREKNISVTINKGEKVIDMFEGIQLKWDMICSEPKQTCDGDNGERKSIQLSFHRKYMQKVLNHYLPHIIERSNAIKEENKVVKLYSLGNFYGDYDGGAWGSTTLDHPSTFNTIAMDPTLKDELIDDLNRFVRRRNFYKRVGKAWKRGYLLYGPPGTGKSSLIAAMANYLKFSIYDMELTSFQSNAKLKRMLVSTTNGSILVIEDIDCSINLQNRQAGGDNPGDGEFTLSGLLNFIDGLWSSCGDERIIVFTTNHKDRLDPALLRPGRMDMHIHMSYCTPPGFKILASNYLGIKNHSLFTEIEGLILEVQVTPAEIAEELMKSEDVNVSLQGLSKFLQIKKMEQSKLNKVHEDKGKESEEIIEAEKKPLINGKPAARVSKRSTVGNKKKAENNKRTRRGKKKKKKQ